MGTNRHHMLVTQQSLQTDQGTIDYTLKRSSRRRSLAICVAEKGQVIVYVPHRTAEKEIIGFLKDKAQWIVNHVADAKKHADLLEVKQFTDGQEFLYLGKKYKLRIEENDIKRSRLQFDDMGWKATIPPRLTTQEKEIQVKNRMEHWYRLQAKEILGGRIFHYARIMGVAPKKIVIRTQKQMWGSCDYHTQTINLNWQIIMSPLAVVDYIVVHELSHLSIPNHSKRFWKKVEKFLPEFRQQKKWLKSNHLNMFLP